MSLPISHVRHSSRPRCRWTLKYDNIAKPFAFLCVAHFFRAFPTPEKIMLQASGRPLTAGPGVTLVCCRGGHLLRRPRSLPSALQVYVALCRLSQNPDPAAREAVRKAIDIMIPNLARAAASEAAAGGPAAAAVAADAGGADSVISKDSAASGPSASAAAAGAGGASLGSPSYARYLKRVLTEDGHITATLVHLLQIIVRNRDMFYSSRWVHTACMRALQCEPDTCQRSRWLVCVSQGAVYDGHAQCRHTAGAAGQPVPGEPQSFS